MNLQELSMLIWNSWLLEGPAPVVMWKCFSTFFIGTLIIILVPYVLYTMIPKSRKLLKVNPKPVTQQAKAEPTFVK